MQWPEANLELTAAHYDLTGYDTHGATYEGAEYAYTIDVGPTPTSVNISMTNNTSDMDLMVFSSCRTSRSPVYWECLGLSATRHNGSETLTIHNASGQLYIIVEGAYSYNNSAFTLQVTCGATTNSDYNNPTKPHYLEDCSSGRDISCGESIYISSMGNNSFNKSNYDISNCSHAAFDYDGHDQIFNIDAGYGNKKMTILLTEMRDDLDMFLFRKCSNGSVVRFTDCVEFSYNSGIKNERMEIHNASGEYVLVVDGYTHKVNSSFRLYVECEEAQTSSSCRDARQLYCGSSLWVQPPTHNNLSKSDYDLSACGYNANDYQGKDHIFRIDAGSGYRQKLEIEISGYSAAMDLLVFQSCQTGYYSGLTLSNCKTSNQNFGSTSKKITIDDASGEYYIVVENTDPWYSSGYNMRVSCVEEQRELCNYATPLYCGDSKWVAAPHVNQVQDQHYDYSNCAGRSTYGYSGYDHIYQINAGTGGKDLVVGLKGLFADLDVLIFEDCRTQYGSYSFRNCAGYGINRGATDEEIVIKDAKGIYYVVIDSSNPWDRSGYEINVDCREPYQSFSCRDAKYITCGEEIWSDAPTHNNMTSYNYGTSGCSTTNEIYIGNDHLYEFYVGPRSRNVTIKMSGLVEDLDMLIFSSCSENYNDVRLSSCRGFSGQSRNAEETIHMENASGTYYLAIDARKSWHISSYKLLIECEEITYADNPNDDVEEEDKEEEPSEPDTPDEDEDDVQEDTVAPSGPLTCGGTMSGTTIDGSSSYAQAEISECFETNLLFTGPDVLVPFEIGSNSFSLIMRQADANLSLFVLDSDLNFMSTGCRGTNYSDDGSISNGSITGEVYSSGTVEPGTYYALIEGYISRIESDFSLSLTCDAPCTTDATFGCETLMEGMSGTSNGQMIYVSSDDSELVGFTGPEWRGELIIEEESDISIYVHNIEGEGSLGIFLSDTCGSSFMTSVLATDEEVSLEANVSPGTYLITVDGWHGADLTYDIEISGCADNTAAAAIATARSHDITNEITQLSASASPNPFVSETRLEIQSDTDGLGSLRILSLDGRLLYDYDISIKAGYNNLIVDSERLGDYSGIMIYQVAVGHQIVQGKMIRVN